ncbi:redoxin domain-containing protein [Georgenia sp. 10Sc9-8]|uniref:Redoxin domain-containing protein n=1 Tax=Georgenia halotolerans TaxID=3028317 RepID=A0ABT5TYN3_9MICO|nr:redoxin domain-containing protein [Georgenia halotolerans]
MTGPEPQRHPALGHPAPGHPVPDFCLPDVHGTPVRLSDLRGAPVLVVFLPFAFSRVCTGEVHALQRDRGMFDARDVRLLGVTCDPVPALRAWTETEGIHLDLLSDFWPHGRTAADYGVLDERSGFARRGSFLVDADGVLRWSVVTASGTARAPAAYREGLRRLPASATPTH